MAPTVPGNKHSVQNILNWSFDPNYNIISVGFLGLDGSTIRYIKVNSQGEIVTAATGGEQALQLDDVTTTNVTYVGVAPIGTSTSAAGWQIKRIDESGTPNTLVITWADGDDSYNNVWDNRGALSYS
jgi:hypothetical protein